LPPTLLLLAVVMLLLLYSIGIWGTSDGYNNIHSLEQFKGDTLQVQSCHCVRNISLKFQPSAHSTLALRSIFSKVKQRERRIKCAICLQAFECRYNSYTRQ
jgi:hypothetical protein